VSVTDCPAFLRISSVQPPVDPCGRFPSRPVLDHLASYACYETGRRTLSASGNIRIFHREAHVDAALANMEVAFFESLDGLEARVDGQCVAVLRDYRTYMHVPWPCRKKLLPELTFDPRPSIRSPRIAVAH
jgi:hypothetical protein